jgi:hypothetical protein
LHAHASNCAGCGCFQKLSFQHPTLPLPPNRVLPSLPAHFFSGRMYRFLYATGPVALEHQRVDGRLGRFRPAGEPDSTLVNHDVL